MKKSVSQSRNSVFGTFTSFSVSPSKQSDEDKGSWAKYEKGVNDLSHVKICSLLSS